MKTCFLLLVLVLYMCGCTNQLPGDAPECANVDKSLPGTTVTIFSPTTEKTKCGAHTFPVGAFILSILGAAL